jgi:hypothetical protein
MGADLLQPLQIYISIINHFSQALRYASIEHISHQFSLRSKKSKRCHKKWNLSPVARATMTGRE